jgi:hypothetical protein
VPFRRYQSLIVLPCERFVTPCLFESVFVAGEGKSCVAVFDYSSWSEIYFRLLTCCLCLFILCVSTAGHHSSFVRLLVAMGGAESRSNLIKLKLLPILCLCFFQTVTGHIAWSAQCWLVSWFVWFVGIGIC